MSDQQRSRFSAHSITAVMAIITAAIALAIGVWENVQMREHNRLAVTPHLQLTAEFHSASADSLDRGIIRVSNQGVGPAVIDRVEVVATGQDGQKQRFETWGAVRALLKEQSGVTLSRRVELGQGVMFGAGQSLELAIFEKSSTTDEPLFPLLLERLDFRIFYHSVYGDVFETDLRRQRTQVGV